MASITAAGTGSGLDIELIITQLVAAEREPEEARLNLRETEIQAEITAFNSLEGVINDFRGSLSNLNSLSSIASRTATSSDTDTFTATADETAAVGSATITVEQLASTQRLTATVAEPTASDAVGLGQINISVGGNAFSVTIDSASNSLAGIRSAINDASNNTGVTASLLQVDDGSGGTEFRLVLSADQSGAANEMTITVTGDSDGDDTDNDGLSAFIFDPTDPLASNMNENAEALDGRITVDGFNVTSSNNTFEGALQGVTITALAQDPGVDKTVTIGIDSTSVSTNLQTFIASFNALGETLNFLTDFDIAENEAGLLTGDFTARTIEQQVRRSISQSVEGLTGNYTSLSAIGITTQRDGSLTLDTTVLDEALSSDFDGVSELLAGDSGIISSLDSVLDSFLNSTGLLAARQQTYSSQLTEIAEQRVELTTRVEALEGRLRRQYTNLDILVAQLNSTGDFVTQQLELNKNVVGNNNK